MRRWEVPDGHNFATIICNIKLSKEDHMTAIHINIIIFIFQILLNFVTSSQEILQNQAVKLQVAKEMKICKFMQMTIKWLSTFQNKLLGLEQEMYYAFKSMIF